MNITYRNENGIMIPNVKVPDAPKTPLGIYGRMRRDYLKQNHRSIYSAMMLQGTLIAHLVEIDKTYENELIFEAVEGAGFRFGNRGGNLTFIPCYSEQNGYYTTEIDIFYNGRAVLHLENTECVYNLD